MKWTLILLSYTVTGADVPHEIRTYELGFATEALCLTAREQVENDLRTRAVTTRATCVQTSE